MLNRALNEAFTKPLNVNEFKDNRDVRHKSPNKNQFVKDGSKFRRSKILMRSKGRTKKPSLFIQDSGASEMKSSSDREANFVYTPQRRNNNSNSIETNDEDDMDITDT